MTGDERAARSSVPRYQVLRLVEISPLTPVLTPTWAHSYGQLWTDLQKLSQISEPKDDNGRLWTREPYPQPHGAGSIPVPPAFD